jgi:hypothetical protein
VAGISSGLKKGDTHVLEQTRRTVLVSLNTAALVLALIMNALANALPLNGRNTGEISDSIPNLFVPAGITFSIWGVIYTFLIVLVVYQIRSVVKREDPNPAVDRLGVWFSVSSMANALWIVTWHWQMMIPSLVIMLVLLVSLVIMHTKIRREFFDHEIGTPFKVAVSLPISLYLGWITVATIANVTAVLVVFGWNGFGLSQPFWTVLMISIAVMVNLLAVALKGDIWFAGVGMWALLGIYLKRTSLEVEPVQSVIITSIIGLILLAAAITAHIIIKHNALSKRV